MLHPRRVLEHPQQVLPVRALPQPLRLSPHFVGGDQSKQVRDLLGAGDLEPLPQLDLLDEVRGAEERLLRAGVEPGVAASELLDGELAHLEVAAIEVGDLQLAARRRRQILRQLDDALIVEVEPRHGEVRLRLLRLLLDADGAPAPVEVDDAVALRVVHAVGEDGGAALARAGAVQRVGEAVAVEDVVAEDEADRTAADEVRADQEGLGDAGRDGLDLVGER